MSLKLDESTWTMSLNLDKSTWARVALGEVAAASKEKCDPQSGDIERYIAGDHMASADLKIHRWGHVDEVDLGPAFHRRFRPGQVLYGSRRTYLRKVAVAEFDGVCANTTYVIETKNENRLSQKFLPFLMSSEKFHDFAISESKGSVNPYVNWSDIERFEFDLPPLDEQQRIADLMWAVERHSRSASDLLTSNNQLLERLREHEFSQISAITKAREAFSITIGRQRSPKHQQGDHLMPYLRSANITKAGIDVGDVKKMNFTPAEQQKYSLHEGDVLVTEASASEHAVGMPAVWRDDLEDIVCFQNTLLRFRALPDISLAGYVKHWSHWAFESGAFLAAASGTNIKHIGARGASNMSVPLPGITEQEAMVSRFEIVEKAGRSVLSELESLKSLRLTLLNEIFGGK